MHLSGLLGFETPTQSSFYIFGLEIYYYAVCIILGLLVATCFTALLMHRKNISLDLLLFGFIIMVPCAIIGARVYACISEGTPIEEWISGIRQGGLSIMGGIIGGVIGFIIFCLIKKLNLQEGLRLADCILPTFPLAQAIGRWGNYFNQEVYGGLVTDPSLQFFPLSVFITKGGVNEWHYAFFFYESIVNFCWFLLLFLFAWKMFKKPNGLFTGAFFLFYGVVRAIMEPLRDPQFQYGNGEGIDSSLISAYLLIAVGVVVIVSVLLYNKRKEGKFFGSAMGDPYTITCFIASETGEKPIYTHINALTKLKKQGKIKPEWERRNQR